MRGLAGKEGSVLGRDASRGRSRAGEEAGGATGRGGCGHGAGPRCRRLGSQAGLTKIKILFRATDTSGSTLRYLCVSL